MNKQTKQQSEAAPACGQHEPGPWEASGHDGKTKVIIYSRWGEICRCSPENAPLIASAPDLLAQRDALKTALESCFAMLTSSKFSGWIDANCADDELWAMTAAMILRRDEAEAALALVGKGDK